MSASQSEIVGPFTDAVQQASTLLWTITSDNVPNDLHWDRLLITLFLAICLFVYYRGSGSKNAKGEVRRTGLLNYLLPKDIYTHVSARVDIWLWVLERVLRPVWVVTLFATVGPITEQYVIASLQWIFGATPAIDPIMHGCCFSPW